MSNDGAKKKIKTNPARLLKIKKRPVEMSGINNEKRGSGIYDTRRTYCRQEGQKKTERNLSSLSKWLKEQKVEQITKKTNLTML